MCNDDHDVITSIGHLHGTHCGSGHVDVVWMAGTGAHVSTNIEGLLYVLRYILQQPRYLTNRDRVD